MHLPHFNRARLSPKPRFQLIARAAKLCRLRVRQCGQRKNDAFASIVGKLRARKKPSHGESSAEIIGAPRVAGIHVWVCPAPIRAGTMNPAMKLKQEPEDFQVEELTDVAPGQDGPFA